MKKFHNDHPSSIFYPALHMGAELKQKYQLTRIMLIIKKNILELYKIYCPKTLPAPYAPHAWYPSPPIDPSQPLRRSPCPFLQHKPVPQYSHGPSCLLHEFQHSFPKFFKPLWENNWFEWSSLWYDIIYSPDRLINLSIIFYLPFMKQVCCLSFPSPVAPTDVNV